MMRIKEIAQRVVKMKKVITVLKQAGFIFSFIFLLSLTIPVRVLSASGKSTTTPVSVTAAGVSSINTSPVTTTTTTLASQSLKSLDGPANLNRDLDKHYDLILFYSVSCTYCPQFCRTLKNYAWQNRIPVIAFKLTNESSPYFPNSVLVDQKTIEQFFGKGTQISVPALFVLNPGNMNLYPVSRGNLSDEELSLRMNSLMQKIRTYEERNRV
jgi:hypothetical protein